MKYFASWENATDEQLEADFKKDINTLAILAVVLVVNLVTIAVSFWSN